jgi:putative phage-type endonuclease
MDEIKIIKSIINTLPAKIRLKSTFTENDFNIIKNYVINTIKIFYRDVNIVNIETSMLDIFSIQKTYTFNPNITPFIPKFTRIEDKDDYYDNLIDNIFTCSLLDIDSVSIEDVTKIKWYLTLKHLPQPVQKSREWYDMRNNMITASIGASIINESPYQKADEVLRDKLGLGEPYKENKYVHHGKKYEKIATMIYENLYNTKVGEFGLIPYQSKPTFSFLGASPDGISSPLTLDGKLNSKMGTMLEIKCPLSRKIKTSGKIDGTICPHYYWVQIQLQLACCDLSDCDFWQCNISDCSYADWINYIECNIVEEQNTLLTNYNKNIIKGCILQFLPKNKLYYYLCLYKSEYINRIYNVYITCLSKEKK